MWLYLATVQTGSLLILLASDLWSTIASPIELAQTPSYPALGSDLSKNWGKLYHRGSGRREIFQRMHSAIALT
ncbi:hypothetical protein K9N68_23065 [Kovacikia minuta CCNUW1]|uniref:hypothetical protein n=1 Tax=Kovacikia minuta TaxID=2931930 RepID=UPI001CCD0F02|nr:hypothetical protein [Kovacikia minuta]UBF24551.1 hypothetical protein K9N68_23065 [Kovacikia minuta CCNUW1]